ncbi:MAG: TolC family protein, partial [bacterium]|nr:TolC family protein [bacterium]
MKNLFPLFAILGSLMLAASYTTTVSADSPCLTVPKNSSVRNIGMIDTEPTEEPGGVITLGDALQAAMGRHPSLAAAWHEIKAHEGKARQAGMLPNPSLSGEFEEFGGSGEFSGSDVISTRISISQEFPLGGKLTKRVQEAEAEIELSIQERAVQIIALRTEVKKRFIRVYMLQEQLKLEQEKLRLVKASSNAISKRVSAGEAS